MTEAKIVSAMLNGELVDELDRLVENDPELSQSQLIREGLRMRLQHEQE